MRIATLTLACSALFLAACGNNDNSGGACTTSAPSGGPAFVGAVSFSFSTLSTGKDYSVDANVYPNFGQATLNASTNCPGAQLGACCYVPSHQLCALPMQTSAGNITVSKGSQSLGTVVFSDGYYSELNSSGSSGAFSWQPGDTLSVSATGAPAMAAAFTGSVVAPPDLANLSPAFTGTLTIPKSTDFVLTWTPGTGNAQARFYFEDISLAAVTCSAPLANGTLTVPAALLKMLGGGGSAIASTVVTSSATGSDAAVVLRAYGNSLIAQAAYPAN